MIHDLNGPGERVDLDALRSAIAGEEDMLTVPVTRRLLSQMADEIAAGRAAQARLRAHEATQGVCQSIVEGSPVHDPRVERRTASPRVPEPNPNAPPMPSGGHDV